MKNNRILSQHIQIKLFTFEEKRLLCINTIFSVYYLALSLTSGSSIEKNCLDGINIV